MLGDTNDFDGLGFLGIKKQESSTQANIFGLQKNESGGNELQEDSGIYVSQHNQTHTQKSEHDFNEMLDTQLPLLGLSL